MYDRRTFLKEATVASLLGAISTGALLAKDFDEVVRIGYLPITDSSALLIAHELGFFKEEGLKSARPTLIRGWSPLVEGFMARKFNVVNLLKPIPIWMRFANKIPVKIVSWGHTNGSAILAGQHINSIKDLGGKNLAVPYWYSIHNIILQKVLRSEGLKPIIKNSSKLIAKNEVNLQILPPPEMPLALLSKKIDGYIVAEPFNALGELKAKAKILRFTGDIWKNHPCCVLTMHENVLKKHKQWSQRVINAIVKAQLFASQNKKDVAKILSNSHSKLLPFDNKIIQRAMNYYDVKNYTNAIRHADDWKNGRIDFQPYPYSSATEFIIEGMQDTLVEGNKKFLENIDIKKSAKDILDDTFVRNALKKHPNWTNILRVDDKKNPFVRREVLDI